jgi:hypothetical protein
VYLCMRWWEYEKKIKPSSKKTAGKRNNVTTESWKRLMDMPLSFIWRC